MDVVTARLELAEVNDSGCDRDEFRVSGWQARGRPGLSFPGIKVSGSLAGPKLLLLFLNSDFLINDFIGNEGITSRLGSRNSPGHVNKTREIELFLKLDWSIET